jgi:hypothetical protein
LQIRRIDMQANTSRFVRLLSGLVAFATVGGADGERVRLVAQHIEMLGVRQWLGVAAASFAAMPPVIAPVAQGLAAAWSRKPARETGRPAKPVFHVLTDNFA